jgi:predicted lipoprotein with Yx(FWY)xxD motif
VLPDRRTVALASGALAALTAMALSACAPVSGDEYGSEPVGEKAAASSPEAPAEEAAAEDPQAQQAPEDLTTQLIGKKVPRMGRVVTDEKGWILYRFDADTADPPASNCNNQCQRVWPPAYTDGNPIVKGVDEDLVGTVTRDDGTRQLTINGWAVYRYIGDRKPGQWTGQAVAGKWFVISPDGKKNITCLPEGTPKAVAPPPAEDEQAANDEEAAAEPAGDSGGYDY